MGKLYEFKEEDAYSFARHVHIQAKAEGVNFNFFIVHTVEAAKVARTREPFLSIYKLDSLSVSDQAAVFPAI